MTTTTLEIFDQNANYWLSFSNAQHPSSLDCSICVELTNTGKLKSEEVPEDAIFIMNKEDAEYLYAWLGCFLKK